jgi:hypothetical protein
MKLEEGHEMFDNKFFVTSFLRHLNPLRVPPPSFSLEKFLFFEFFFPIVIDSLRETLSIAVSITSIGLAVLEIFQF